MATADAEGAPHVVPVCYAFDGSSIYSALDLKPKRVSTHRLKRVRNIAANPRVALVIDDYSEEWSALRYVLVRGSAEVMEAGGGERPGGGDASREVSPVRQPAGGGLHRLEDSPIQRNILGGFVRAAGQVPREVFCVGLRAKYHARGLLCRGCGPSLTRGGC